MKRTFCLIMATILFSGVLSACASGKQYGEYSSDVGTSYIIYDKDEGESEFCLAYPDVNLQLDVYGDFEFAEDGSGKITFASYQVNKIDESIIAEDQELEDQYITSLTNTGESFISIGYMFASYQETDSEYAITLYDSGNDILGIYTKGISEE